MPSLVMILSIMALGCAAQHIDQAVPVEQPAANPGGERKVIDNAWLELRVDNLDAVSRQLMAALNDSGGYVVDMHLRYSPSHGRWTVRIPANRLPSFLETARTWGVVLSSRITAEDVTEQFIDVTARVASKRVEEQRLLKLLQERTGGLTDVLAVEQQLQRVRQEIEQAQGRQHFLDNATTFATVHLTASVDVVVTWSAGQPLGTQFAAVFRDSFHVLVKCGRAALLVAAVLLPWMLVLAVPAGIGYRLLRRRSPTAPNFPVERLA